MDDSMKPTLPPEPAPPTLDPAMLVKALEAAKAESVAVCKEYNDRIDGFLKRGGTVRDEAYYGLTTRLDAAMWSSQRVSEIIDRALTGTPTLPAAPPTVAPARLRGLGAWLLLEAKEWRDPAGKAVVDSVADEGPYPVQFHWLSGGQGANSIEGFLCDNTLTGTEVMRVVTAAIERDRASRSPGPLSGLDAATVEGRVSLRADRRVILRAGETLQVVCEPDEPDAFAAARAEIDAPLQKEPR